MVDPNNAANGQIEVWLDGQPVNDLTMSRDLGTAPVRRLQLGENATGRTYDIAFDDAAADTNPISGGGGGGMAAAAATEQESSEAEPASGELTDPAAITAETPTGTAEPMAPTTGAVTDPSLAIGTPTGVLEEPSAVNNPLTPTATPTDTASETPAANETAIATETAVASETPTSTPEPTETATETATPTPTETGVATEPTLPPETPTAAGDIAPDESVVTEEEPAATGTATISGAGKDGVACRVKPSAEAKVVVRLADGALVELRGKPRAGWQPVECAGHAGFVRRDRLADDGAANPPPDGGGEPPASAAPSEPEGDEPSSHDATIAGAGRDGAACRAEPRAGAKLLRRLRYGQAIELIGEPTGEWQPVRCAGRAGFVRIEFIDPTPASDGGASEPATDRGTLGEQTESEVGTTVDETGSIETPASGDQAPGGKGRKRRSQGTAAGGPGRNDNNPAGADDPPPSDATAPPTEVATGAYSDAADGSSPDDGQRPKGRRGRHGGDPAGNRDADHPHQDGHAEEPGHGNEEAADGPGTPGQPNDADSFGESHHGGSPYAIAEITDSAGSPSAGVLHDTDLGTVWRTELAELSRQAWVVLDLGRVRPVGRIRWIAGEGGLAGAMKIQVSQDGKHWRTLGQPGGNGDGKWRELRTGRPVDARYVRFLFANPGDDALLGGLAEVEVLPTDAQDQEPEQRERRNGREGVQPAGPTRRRRWGRLAVVLESTRGPGDTWRRSVPCYIRCSRCRPGRCGMARRRPRSGRSSRPAARARASGR